MAKVSIFFRTYIFLCIAALLLFQAETVRAQNGNGSALKKVVIDAGHGGRDGGAPGAKSKEKDIVLDVSLRLGKMIQEKYPDVEVIYTRKTDVFVEHYKRTDIANKAHANLFISIHANAVKKGSRCPSGAETFVMGNDNLAANMEVAKRENEVIYLEDDYTTRYEGFDPQNPESYIILSLMQNTYLYQSTDFAAEVQAQLKKTAQRVDRGVKQAILYVMYKTAMPSVLVELGFICNPEEEKYMNSAAGKDKLATSIFQAFCSYKSKIEDRSSFSLGEHTTDAEQSKTGSAPSQPQQTAVPANHQPKSADPQKPKVEFCVQISYSTKPMDTHPNNFKKYRNVERIQVSANSFKYIVGRTADYAAAQETLKKVRADFKDAFVVSIADGKILSAAEGLKMLNN